jgi:N6-L-threonylcarbamoyladenine synthase
LLVGISFAKSLSLALDIPVLGINHLHSHIYASFLDKQDVRLPFIALVASGGHTSLYRVLDFDKIKLLGSTHDDACGEAFDKVAKILKVGYPGGPIIERLARNGNIRAIRFKCSDTDNPLDFSFSGIKTAVLYYVQKNSLNRILINDITASFQETVIDTLIKKSFLACKLKKLKRLVIGGGVAANERLRTKFYQQAKDAGLNIYFPSKELCMDNAAMVAGLGYRLFRKGHISDLTLSANSG